MPRLFLEFKKTGRKKCLVLKKKSIQWPQARTRTISSSSELPNSKGKMLSSVFKALAHYICRTGKTLSPR